VLKGKHEFVYAYNSVNQQGSREYPEKYMSYHSLNARGYFSVDFFTSFGGAVLDLGMDTGDIYMRDLKIVHGTLMYTLWGINIVVGAMVARFQKHTTWWLGVHRLLQLCSSLTTLPVFYLTKFFVDGYFQSWHGILGYVILVFTTLQATMGSFMYSLPKHHRSLAQKALDSPDLSPAIKNCIRKGKKVSKHPNIYRGVESLSPEEQDEINGFVKSNFGNGGLYDKALLWCLKYFELTICACSHRILGRTLILIAYLQVYLGLQLLHPHYLVNYMIFVWTFIIGTILVYKECEMRRQLPKGFTPKAKALASMVSESSSFRMKKKEQPRQRPSNRNVTIIEEANDPEDHPQDIEEPTEDPEAFIDRMNDELEILHNQRASQRGLALS